MALPPSVAERLGRKGPEDSPAFFGQLTFFAIAIFAASSVLYAGLRFGYMPFVKSRISGLDADIAAAEKLITKDDKMKVLTLHSGLTNLQNLLKETRSAADHISWLQSKTLTSVQYAKLDFNRDTGVMNVAGWARTMEDFTAQMRTFQQDTQVKLASFGHVRPSGNNWEFDMSLQLVVPDKK